jgi:hypothetical protein
MKKILTFALSAGLLMLSSAHAEDAANNDSVSSQEWRAIVEPLAPIGGRMAALLPDTTDPQLR